MADASDTMRYLVKQVDIAPAGTREEGEAAKNLSVVFHKHGLETANKSFKFSPFAKTAVALLAGITGIVGILSGVASGVFSVIMFVIGLVATALFFLERYGIRTVSRIPGEGSSQNIVARHPAASTANGQKARPVVVIAHYDTPRADLLSTPLLAPAKPYLPTLVAGCMAVDVVAMLLQLLPLPLVVRNVAWAVAIVSSILPLLWGVNAVIHRFVMPFTAGANDNKSGVAAVFGLLDRVRPIQGGAGFGPDDALYESGVEEGAAGDAQAMLDEDEARMAKVRHRNPNRSAELSTVMEAVRSEGERKGQRPVRYGAEVVRSLGILPETCTIVYEDKEAPAVHRASRVAYEQQGREAQGGETALIPAVAAAVDAGGAAPSPDETVVERPVDKDAAADAIMAGIVGSNGLSGSQAPEAVYEPPAAPAPAAATSLMTAITAEPVAPVQETPVVQPFHVITSTDDYDVELRNAASFVPPDVAEQSAQLSTSFTIDDPDSFSAAVVSDPSWGTSSFKPVSAERRILSDIPDPAVAAVDPFSVTGIEPVGGYNPEDFSTLDFETGTHQAITPAMLEEVRRRNLDGFSAEITETKRGRKAKKGRQGRISHQAARMQAEMEESSFNDWLGLDEGFDAKTGGQQIGSWDNFADDGPIPGAQGLNGDPYGNGGGAPRWQGGAARARRTPRRASAPAENDGRDVRRAAMTLGDRELISHEIWFVLTGASDADHAGVRDFLQTYRNELRGAYFVNLSCVGAGRECLIVEEGTGCHVKADRRLVNLFGQASQAINRPFALSRLDWCDTEATPLLQQGCRAVTVCGMERGVPAHAEWKGDTPEKVDPAMIDDVVDVLVEVIKNA